jgi:hypothetical protein
VAVDGAAGAGIFNEGGTHGKIISSTVQNTRADGIHTMGGVGWDVVYGNTVANTGDDMISIVSYHNWATNHDIEEDHNTRLGNTWGRGMSVVGGTNIQLHDNTIAHSHAAAIYVEAEGNANPDIASWPIAHVTIDRNTVRSPDEGLIHNANILVGTFQTTVTDDGDQGIRQRPRRLEAGATHRGQRRRRQRRRVLRQLSPSRLRARRIGRFSRPRPRSGSPD